MNDAVNPVIIAASSGIPRLYEWGGLVTLLVLLVIALLFAIVALGWVIWQMYKNNQEMFKASVDATNRGTNAVEKLSEYIRGLKA